jgi:FAD/FMN-containing dehydrogenase
MFRTAETGNDSRRCGLTCDALASATVVLPSGETVTAGPGEHDDLLWALRGGGGGNFGVTTSLTFKTFPASDSDVVNLAFAGAAAPQAIAGWQNWLAKADRAVWAMVDITLDPAAGQRCGLVLVTPAGGGATAAADLTAAVGVAPLSDQRRTLNPLDLVGYLAGGAAGGQPKMFVAGGATIFGRRLRQLHRAKHHGRAVFRGEPGQAFDYPAEVRPGSADVLRPQLLTSLCCARRTGNGDLSAAPARQASP